MKIVGLQSLCPNKLVEHLELQTPRLTSYALQRQEVLRYIEAHEARSAASGAVPMDVDQLAAWGGKGGGSERR